MLLGLLLTNTPATLTELTVRLQEVLTDRLAY